MSLSVDIRYSKKTFSLSFECEFPSAATGLFGPSGSGKTTLLYCLAGLIRPDWGMITLDGEVLFDAAKSIHIPPHKRKIGLVFQDCMLFPHLSVLGNIQYGQTGDSAACRQRMEEMISLFDIGHLLDRRINHLSGGEKKRVAMARAIVSNPRWLLLDEPFAGLDQQLKDQILPYLRRLHQVTRIPMILVSHNPDDIVELTDYVIFIEQGKTDACGRVEKVSNHPGRCGLCGSQAAGGLRNTRNLLLRNHSLRFGDIQRGRGPHFTG